MARPVVYAGVYFTVTFARDGSGACPGEEFFDSLPLPDRAKRMTLFKMIGDLGRITNPEKCGNLKDGLYEFESHQIRVPFAYAGPPERKTIVISHGFIKKTPKANPEEIARARRILNEDQTRAKLGLVRKAKTMTTKYDELMSDPEFRRAMAIETCIAEAAEAIARLMADQNLTKADVAHRLGKSRAWVTQLLNGKANMTIRTFAEVIVTLGGQPSLQSTIPQTPHASRRRS